MTLGEHREQIAQLEQVLAQLKDEKHQLFLQLKKVLNEDDNRRRQLVRQQESRTVLTTCPSDVIEFYGGLYSGVAPSMGTHLSQLVIQPNYQSMPDRAPVYKVPSSLLATTSHKRPRSPTPPPPPLQPGYPTAYNQKAPPPPPAPVARVSYQKNPNYYYPTPGTSGISVTSQSGYTYTGPSYPVTTSRTDSIPNDPPPPKLPMYISQPMSRSASSQGQQYTPSSRSEALPSEQPSAPKHPVYMAHPIPRPSMNPGYMHGNPMEHQKVYQEDKFHPLPPVRPATYVPIHGGAIPIQQPAQGTKTGGITSGYPISRSSASVCPPHITPSASTSHVNISQNSYPVSQPPSQGRLVYSQAGLPHTRYHP